MTEPPLEARWPRRRLAVVVQRYGDGLLGGAEWHAASFIAAVKHHHDVTVFTSCAHDATSWAMHHPPGESWHHGVRVLRFAHPVRNADGRARVPRRHKLRFLARRWLDALHIKRVARPGNDDVLDGHQFLRRQGPCCEGLLQALGQRRDEFDGAVFFTALYHPTAQGLPLWGRRSVLVPTLHDEKAMYLPWFHRVFASAGKTLWNTAAEQRLAQRLYGPSATGPGAVVGAAVHTTQPSGADTAAARERHGLPQRYVVYVGRIEKGKGCAELLSAWLALGDAAGDAALVFIGTGAMAIPTGPRVRVTGFLEASERDALLAGAAALVMPSRLESLSLVLLEAMALGVPVLANRRCEPLRDHVERSGAGHVYNNPRQLQAGLLAALERSAADRLRQGQAGRHYSAAHYAPAVIHGQWLQAIDEVCSPGNAP